MVTTRAPDLAGLEREIVSCRACPRLVHGASRSRRRSGRRSRDEEYWGKPVPGFGDPRARVLFVGLAPAAHGGNRTGRVFTGDRSGDFLFASLHRTGFANQAESVRAGDGLRLRDAYVAAAVRCAPPANKPTPAERDECRPYLVRELQLLARVRVIVALGIFGYEAAWSVLGATSAAPAALRARRRSAVRGVTLLGAFHPSQQNTFTGKLTPAMLDAVFDRAPSAQPGDELADRVDRGDDRRARCRPRRRSVRSDASIVRRAPTCAPGITPIASGIANVQSMWPRYQCVSVPGIAKMPTHASDVAIVVLQIEAEPGRERGHHEDAAADAEQSREQPGRRRRSRRSATSLRAPSAATVASCRGFAVPYAV